MTTYSSSMTAVQPALSPLETPYYCQWETPSLAEKIITGAATPLDDPLWRNSGASSVEEYALWSNHACGMACLKMILAGRTGQVWPTVDLAQQAKTYGAYVQQGGAIRGLIYAPFVRFVDDLFGLEARVEDGKKAADIEDLMMEGDYFIASVHPSIRWPGHTPPQKGGHLVLVLDADDDEIVFHNPSGISPETQQKVRMKVTEFDRFFAGRGILILRDKDA